MRAVLVAVGLALLGAAGGEAAEPQLVDLTLAEIGGRLVALSDVALSRALGLYGLAPSDGPITVADLERYLDAQLAVREATQLAIDVPADDVERAWEAAGGAALGAWLDSVGVERAWARRLLEADLRAERFVELRFRAFAFVSDFDVDEALGSGPHDEAARAKTRERLRAEMVARSLAAWKATARKRVEIKRVPGTEGPWPAPFSWPSRREPR